MKWFLTALVSTLTLCLVLRTVLGIRCYICNSNDHPKNCSNDFADKSFLKECSSEPRYTGSVFCRKIKQSVDKILNMGSDDRIIRQCGTLKAHRECYYRAGFGSRQEVCSCDTDECNSAPNTFIPVAMPLLATMSAASMLIHRLLL